MKWKRSACPFTFTVKGRVDIFGRYFRYQAFKDADPGRGPGGPDHFLRRWYLLKVPLPIFPVIFADDALSKPSDSHAAFTGWQ